MKSIVAIVACVILAVPAGAVVSEELNGQLLAALDALGVGSDQAAAEFLAGHLMDPTITDRDWEGVFGTYLEARPFTDAHGDFWRFVLSRTSGDGQARMALLSGLWGAEAVRHGLLRMRASGRADASLRGGLVWLNQLRPGLGDEAVRMVFDRLRGAYTDYWGRVPGAEAPVPLPLVIDLSVVAKRYVPRDDERGRSDVSAMLRLNGTSRQFWEQLDLFLVDNGAMDTWHVDSLVSLLGQVPRELHRIDAVITPDSAPIDPEQPQVLTAMQLAFIPLLPMDRLSNRLEFSSDFGRVAAPEFTLAAAQGVFRAIQEVQLSQRPNLAARRDQLVARCGGDHERTLRPSLSPSVYMDNPSEYLPSMAYLYFLDTSRTFQMALYLYEAQIPDGIDTFLLIADLMTNGGSSTVAYITDEEGRVEAMELPVTRTAHPPLSDDISGAATYVSGLEFPDATWLFDINQSGTVVGMNRR
ncbi:MAG: hypothetical protein GY851_18550 [bacterium]|nr:hypothetical protein [bacterium]